MHDAIIGERLGLPSAGVMTSQFETAAALMARVLGASDYPFVTIEHPISSASEAMLASRAAGAAAACAALLVAAEVA
ncbi:MAG: hypothetical protein AAF384_12055 [Pseudomonadota bacterium]